MILNSQQEKQKQVAQSYYEKINSGNFNDDDYYDLFTDDVKVFYPKFGFAEGKAGIKKFGDQVRNLFKSLTFDLDKFNFIVTDNIVVVEGLEKGTIHTGVTFPDQETSFGKFCTVFEFEGNCIKRMYCYVDPDHAGVHQEIVALLKTNSKLDGISTDDSRLKQSNFIPHGTTEEVVRTFFEILSGKSNEKMINLFADKIDWDIPGNKDRFSWLGKRTTKEECVAFFEEHPQQIEAKKFAVDFISYDGENAVAVGNLSSLILKYDKLYNSNFCIIFKVKAGKIVKYHFLEDSYLLDKEMN